MNRAKARIIGEENRLRESATWMLTQGNRRKTNPDDIFALCLQWRKQIDLGTFKDLDELETWVYNQWALGRAKDPALVLEFSSKNPASGG